MSLKKCKECGVEVSTKAMTCPHCGVRHPGITDSDTAKGCLGGCFGVIAIAVFLSIMLDTNSDKNTQPTIEPNDEPANVAAKEELKNFYWVKDLYASPGHMNIGVIPDEKQWGAPMINIAVCSALKRNGSNLRFVRFVDVYKLSAGKSPRQAEIITVTCSD